MEMRPSTNRMPTTAMAIVARAIEIVPVVMEVGRWRSAGIQGEIAG